MIIDLRVCPKCEESRLSIDFAKNKNKKEGVASWCRACTKKLVNKWYAVPENKKKHKEKLYLRRANSKKRLMDHFGNHCAHCGQSFPPCCYDFHHLDPTKKDYGFGTLGTYSWAVIEKEIIGKCIMLCSNCHRIEHAKSPTLISD